METGRAGSLMGGIAPALRGGAGGIAPALRGGAMSVVAFALCCAARGAHAEDFYVDPEQGADGNAGTAGAPWRTLQQVVEAGRIGGEVGAGDTVWLRSGYHGELAIDGGDYAQPITIAAEAGATPELTRVRIDNARGLTLRGLTISPSFGGGGSAGTMIEISGGARIVVEDCTAFSVADASGWDADAWVNDASNGAEVGGDDVVLRGNTFRNVRFGISVSGERALIERNTVENFSADGLRGLGDHGTFQYNVVKNVYVGSDLDDNHDDGFQSWSNGPGGVGTAEVVGVVLRGNVIINYEDPDQPFRTTLQGIGCFDGTFVDWVVENNVVITDHWHGITLLGARNSRIVNNTVIDPNEQDPGPPWIQIEAHKDGTAPTDCLVRNNLVTDLSLAGSGVAEDHNLIVSDYGALFVDAAGDDLHLLPQSPAVDTGAAELAPELDAEGIARPQGDAVDLGAYEWHDATVTADAGAPRAGVGAGAGAGAGGGGSGRDASAGGGRGGAGGAGGRGESGSGTTAGRGGSGAGSETDGGVAGGGSGGDGDDGCGCGIAGERRSSGALVLLAIAVLRARARRATGRRRARR